MGKGIDPLAMGMEIPVPSHDRTSNYHAGGPELTSADLRTLHVRLVLLATYFEAGTECRRTVDRCIEVVDGLRSLWTRNALERNRERSRHKRRRRKPKR